MGDIFSTTLVSPTHLGHEPVTHGDTIDVQEAPAIGGPDDPFAGAVDFDDDPLIVNQTSRLSRHAEHNLTRRPGFPAQPTPIYHLPCAPRGHQGRPRPLHVLNIMELGTPRSAAISAVIFNALIMPLLIPLSLRGVRYRPMCTTCSAHEGRGRADAGAGRRVTLAPLERSL